jgi:hypothetical protein
LAFSVHSSAVMDIDCQANPTRSLVRRTGRSVAISLALFLLLYMPAGRLLGRIAEPHSITRDMPPFTNGDVVLVRPSAAPRVGQIVLYDIPSLRSTVSMEGHGRFLQYTGVRIDRILAGPGDEVRWGDGGLSVNGNASSWLPLSPQNLPTEMTIHVPPGCFLIFPTSSPEVPAAADTASWKTLSLIPRESIHGRAYGRTQPLWRIALLR